MTTDSQFWWNWYVQFAVALGTISAVFVALFGEALRRKFFPPKLSLTVNNPKGEKTKVHLSWIENGQSKERWEDARFYHLRVSNARRWSPATQVQVVLLGVEEPQADSQFAPSWSGDIPLSWRHQNLFPLLRTIGPDAYIDLCSVRKEKALQIHLLLRPHNLQGEWRENVKLILSLQARSNEADSQVLRVQVSWDGDWDDGAEEMQRHLVIKQI